MKHIMHEREDIDKFVADKEYIANTYVMRCFLISMIVYFIAFLLNILNIFIVDKKIMLSGFIPSVFIYLTMLLITKNVSLSSDKIKYFILFSIVSVFTLIGVNTETMLKSIKYFILSDDNETFFVINSIVK